MKSARRDRPGQGGLAEQASGGGSEGVGKGTRGLGCR